MSSIFTNAEQKKIGTIYQDLEQTDEFEFMFNNYNENPLTITNFLDTLKYLTYRSKVDKLLLETSMSLDVIYNYKENSSNVYRVSITGLENVNKLMNLIHKRRNHVIFTILISKIYNDSEEGLTLIHKVKNRDETINVDDYDIRIRKAKESSVSKKTMDDLMKLNNSEGYKITFRYKQRISLVILDNDDVRIVVDLTSVKQRKDINSLEKSPEIYELEIDIAKKNKSKKNYMDVIYSEIVSLKKILQQSNVLISNKKTRDVLSEYKLLTYGDKNINIKNLYSMQPISAEVQHIVDKIPNKYGVTDKADGEKYCCVILNEEVYFISNNLAISKSGLEADKKLNGTIMEGEYIYLPDYKKYLF